MSPSLELWGAVVMAIRAVLPDVGVYDLVPPNAAFPYVSLGSTWETQDDAECIQAVELGMRIDVWSRSIGSAEARRIADTIRSSLHDAEIELAENALALIEHKRTDTMRDPDGITTHVAIEIAAVIETP